MSGQTARRFIDAIGAYYNEERAANAAWFFKTGKGGYSEGDQFLGATVPKTRLVCKEFQDMPLAEVQKLLDSPIHDHRLGAVIILVGQYKKAKHDAAKRDEIFDLYVKNIRKERINNWDIIDISAAHIIGSHEEATNRSLLFELARSKTMWHRRTAILSAAWYLRSSDPTTTLALAEVLLHDTQDLIQKAVGWQLREVGKYVDRQTLLAFLDKHAATMPRIALRYAIEHLPPEQRMHYLALKRKT
jgi:3-methyladenine DNA glycosylase AlkD